jgi:hypothetical protein
VRLTGLARIIADGYRRDGVVLLVGSTSSALTDDDQRRIAAAFEWLVSHDGVGVWLTERCVVEIDGPDHRGSSKYAADRRRDNGLTLDGFAVLRFTNDEIDDDPARVLAVIHSLLSRKRNDEGNLA